MLSAVTLGITFGLTPQRSLRQWADLAPELEQAGVERIWLLDSPLDLAEVWSALLLAAQRTERVDLGPGSSDLKGRHASVLAASALALDEVSGGRARLGLGGGEGESAASIEAAMRYLRPALAGEEAELEGSQRRLNRAPSGVRIPLHLAALGPRRCRLGGRLADAVTLCGPPHPELIRCQLEWITSGAREAGRDPLEVSVELLVPALVADGSGAALGPLRDWAVSRAKTFGARAQMAADGPEARPQELPEELWAELDRARDEPDRALASLALVGTSAEVEARLSALRRAGIGDFIFPLLGRDDSDMLRRWESIRDLAPSEEATPEPAVDPSLAL